MWQAATPRCGGNWTAAVRTVGNRARAASDVCARETKLATLDADP